MPEPRTKWWRRLLLVIAVGPGAVMLMCFVEFFFQKIERPEMRAAQLACLGGLWGLSGGILRRSLLRAILGLHVGALLGICWAQMAYHFNNEWTMSGILALEGAILGAVLNARTQSFYSTANLGALCGFVGMGAIAASSMIEGYFWQRFGRFPYGPEWVEIPLISTLPLCTGLYLFFWLIADVLPRREVAREQAQPKTE